MRKWTMNELNRKTVEEFKAAPKNNPIIVLENIRSVYNVGSVFRTADAFLCKSIYLCGYTAFPPHPKLLKTALGATESVPWLHFSSAAEAIALLRQTGYFVYALEQTQGATMLQELVLPEGNTALVLGNEVEGVSNETLSLCDGLLEIPQFGTKHSLNIAVAAGIALWKFWELQN